MAMQPDQYAAYMQWVNSGAQGSPPAWVLEDRDAAAQQQAAAQDALQQLSQATAQNPNLAGAYDTTGTNANAFAPTPPPAPAVQNPYNPTAQPIVSAPSVTMAAPTQTFQTATAPAPQISSPVVVDPTTGQPVNSSSFTSPGSMGWGSGPGTNTTPGSGVMLGVPGQPNMINTNPGQPGSGVPATQGTNGQWSATNPNYGAFVNAVNSGDLVGYGATNGGTPPPPPPDPSTTSGTNTPIANAPPVMTVNGRNLMGEGATTLGAQIALAPAQLQQYQQYAPQYAQTDLNTLYNTTLGNIDANKFLQQHTDFQQGYFNALQSGGQSAADAWLKNAAIAGATAGNFSASDIPFTGGTLGLNQFLTNAANQQTISGNTAIRQANVTDASNMGAGALKTIKDLNPLQYGALQQVGEQAGNFIQPNSYQTQLGQAFSAGPQYQQVGGPNINANPVGAAQINGYQSVSAQNNPLLGMAQTQASTNGNTPLGTDLQSLARQQLALGSGLSDQQSRDATQAAREAYAARGLVYSPGAMAQEILNRDQYGQQLLQQREGFAQNVNQLGQSQQGLNNQYTLGVLGATATQGAQSLQAQQANQAAGLNVAQLNQGAQQQSALANQQNAYQAQLANAQLGQAAQLANQQAGLQAQQQNYGLGGNLANMDYARQQQNFGNIVTNAQLQSQNAFNPFALTAATTQNPGLNQSLFNQSGTTSSGGLTNQNVFSQFNPFNSYSSDLYNTNYNGQVAQNIANTNASAGKTSGALSAAGAIGGGLLASGALGTASTGAIGALGGYAGAIMSGKMFVMCIPEGEWMDTPQGRRRIEDLRAGDYVLGYRGAPVIVHQKHEYAERPNAVRFYRFTMDDGRHFAVCDMHRIEGVRAKDWNVGNTLAGEKTITDIARFGGVRRSYDLLTEDGGYRMAGVPVNSMISEMAQFSAAIAALSTPQEAA